VDTDEFWHLIETARSHTTDDLPRLAVLFLSDRGH
jgi:hypothetical protein